MCFQYVLDSTARHFRVFSLFYDFGLPSHGMMVAAGYCWLQMDLLTEAADIFARKNAMPVLPQDDQVGPGLGPGMEKSSEEHGISMDSPQQERNCVMSTPDETKPWFIN